MISFEIPFLPRIELRVSRFRSRRNTKPPVGRIAHPPLTQDTREAKAAKDILDFSGKSTRTATNTFQWIDNLSRTLSRLEEVNEQLTQAQGAALETTREARRNLFVVVPIAALLTLLAAAVLGWHLTRSITVPLSQLASGARALARGDFQHEVNVGGNDELAVLGRTFNQAARQLQELYQELREQASLLSLTHDSIYVRDMNEVIRYWNRGAEVLYGWSAEQAVGELAHELLKTVSPVPVDQIEAELLRSGRWEGELVKTNQDGTQLVVASRCSLKRDDRGEPVAILVTGNDITQRKQAEENLRQSEAYLRR